MRLGMKEKARPGRGQLIATTERGTHKGLVKRDPTIRYGLCNRLTLEQQILKEGVWGPGKEVAGSQFQERPEQGR